jgi:archaeal cell division control protein 6
MQKGLTNFFESYLEKEPLFVDKKPLQSGFTPDNISHRNEQIDIMAKILAPCLRVERPSNIFIYGKTGTGKTLTTKYVTKQIENVASSKSKPIFIHYLNCKLKKMVDTEYRLIAQLAREFGKEVPITGLPTDEIYRMFYESIDNEQKIIILILDEIDHLVNKIGNDVLYNLTRINSDLKNAQICIIGISNDLMFTDKLDPRVKSSLSEEEIVFPPYNALQLQDILKERSEKAFKANCLEYGLIQKCAAYAAREHGDARRALELLRVAGEVAERNGCDKVELKHLDTAEEKIERDRVTDIVLTQPRQQQLVLYSILSVYQNRKDKIFTGEVFEVYRGLCLQTGLKALTQRRISDVIAELDMLGIINANVISKGRYGRTREINLSVNLSIATKVKKLLGKCLDLEI